MTDGPSGDQTPPDFYFEQVLSGGEGMQPFAQGVPAVYSIEAVGESGEWSRRLAEGEAAEELITAINAGITERENDYPGVPLWDRLRVLHAGELFQAGYVEASADLICGMHSRHAMAFAILDLGSADDGRNFDLVLSNFMRRFEGEENHDRLTGLVQALIDLTIEDNPAHPAIAYLERMQADRIPGYDPLRAWADSQRELQPSLDWDGLVSLIKDEGLWRGVPLRFRQCAIKQHFAMRRAIRDEVSTELVESMIESLNGAQEHYPEAEVWDMFKGLLVRGLLDAGYPTFALDCARAIRYPLYQQEKVLDFIGRGFEDEAFELANAIADPNIVAETLFAGDWSDSKGMDRLKEIAEGSNYPAERRLACLRFMHEESIREGNADDVARYGAMIAELRRQLERPAEQG